MTGPMDRPPADHGSDRYDYVEVDAPPGIRPLGWWADALMAEPCKDCRANLFFRFTGGTPWAAPNWQVTIAHDDGCPTHERLTS